MAVENGSPVTLIVQSCASTVTPAEEGNTSTQHDTVGLVYRSQWKADPPLVVLASCYERLQTGAKRPTSLAEDQKCRQYEGYQKTHRWAGMIVLAMWVAYKTRHC